MDKKHKICICLGNRCFSSGNDRNLEFIKGFLHNNALKEEVEFRGCVCNGLCENGPSLKVNEEFIKIDNIEMLDNVLHEKLL
jgi:NADH:ubiquinone oxidoreductase subunit E